MYCPRCLNDSLVLNGRGVVDIVINNKQMDAGRFYFKLDDHQELTVQGLKDKMEEFFKWYSKFNNIEPISLLQLVTNGVRCENGCSLGSSTKISIVDELVPSKEIEKILDDLGHRYSLKIQLK